MEESVIPEICDINKSGLILVSQERGEMSEVGSESKIPAKVGLED